MNGDVGAVDLHVCVCVPNTHNIMWYSLSAEECRPAVNVTTPELSAAHKYYSCDIDVRAGTAVAGIRIHHYCRSYLHIDVLYISYILRSCPSCILYREKIAPVSSYYTAAHTTHYNILYRTLYTSW